MLINGNGLSVYSVCVLVFLGMEMLSGRRKDGEASPKNRNTNGARPKTRLVVERFDARQERKGMGGTERQTHTPPQPRRLSRSPVTMCPTHHRVAVAGLAATRCGELSQKSIRTSQVRSSEQKVRSTTSKHERESEKETERERQRERKPWHVGRPGCSAGCYV